MLSAGEDNSRKMVQYYRTAVIYTKCKTLYLGAAEQTEEVRGCWVFVLRDLSIEISAPHTANLLLDLSILCHNLRPY